MRVAVALAAVALLALANPAHAVERPAYESFEEGWGAWRVDADVWCWHDPDPCTWRWDAFRAPGAAFDGAWGVVTLQEGIHDSGAVWVERSMPVPAGERVEVAFWIFTPTWSPPTAWDARAYVGAHDPESEFELTRVGGVGDVPGWFRYCLSAPAPDAPIMWVAAGVRAAWESGLRAHALDYVSVRGATGGEPCGLLEDPCHVAAAPCTAARKACEVAACPTA